MPTTFDYIDNTIVKDLEAQKANIKLSEAEKTGAQKKAQKLIAGFRVKDEEAEKAELDKLVAARRKGIEKFMSDRETITNSLSKDGVKPLAVIPTETWELLCFRSGLFILTPDKNNRIGYDRVSLYNGFKDAKEAEKIAKNNWKGFLSKIFPTGKSTTASAANSATLILPDPPKEVAETLCKAQKHPLRVAAVAEAISFAENITQLYHTSGYSAKDLWARAQGYEDYADWVKRDPIIFTDYGTATAIIAQFGEFPIEQKIVDAVIAANETIKADAVPEVVIATNPNNVQDQYGWAVGTPGGLVPLYLGSIT